MKNLKEILEGLFSADLEDKVGQVAVEEWLKKYALGDYKFKYAKDGSVAIKGNIKISDARMIPLFISEVDGNMYIEKCTNFTNLTKIFKEVSKVTGTLGIINCPEFDSLEGCPFILKSIELSGLPKLKSLDGLTDMVEKVSIMNCGKKFKKEQVKKIATMARIVCSYEDDEDMITEAFQDPILSRLADALKENKIKRYGYKNLGQLIPGDWKLSEITPSARMEFDIYTDKEKDWVRQAQKIFRRGQYQVDGFVVGYNSDDDQVKFFARTGGSNEVVRFYCEPNYSKDTYRFENIAPADISAWFSKNHLSTIGVDTLYFYMHNYLSGTDAAGYTTQNYDGRYEMQRDRRKAQEGIIYMDEDHMKSYLRDQQERYKKAAAALRAQRGSNKYSKYIDIVNKLMEKFSKVLTKSMTDFAWAEQNEYEIEYLRQAMCQTKEYRPGTGRRGSDGYYIQGGVLERLQKLSKTVGRVQKGEGYANERDIQIIVKDLDKAIENANNYFTKLGF